MRQNIIYKALIRPVLYFGLPMELLFLVTAGPFLIGAWITPKLWLLIPVLVFFLGLLTKKDPFFFHLLHLKWKTTWSMEWIMGEEKKKAAKFNRSLGCQAFSAGKYTSDAKIGVSKVMKFTKAEEL